MPHRVGWLASEQHAIRVAASAQYVALTRSERRAPDAASRPPRLGPDERRHWRGVRVTSRGVHAKGSAAWRARRLF